MVQVVLTHVTQKESFGSFVDFCVKKNKPTGLLFLFPCLCVSIETRLPICPRISGLSYPRMNSDLRIEKCFFCLGSICAHSSVFFCLCALACPRAPQCVCLWTTHCISQGRNKAELCTLLVCGVHLRQLTSIQTSFTLAFVVWCPRCAPDINKKLIVPLMADIPTEKTPSFSRFIFTRRPEATQGW